MFLKSNELRDIGPDYLKVLFSSLLITFMETGDERVTSFPYWEICWHGETELLSRQRQTECSINTDYLRPEKQETFNSNYEYSHKNKYYQGASVSTPSWFAKGINSVKLAECQKWNPEKLWAIIIVITISCTCLRRTFLQKIELLWLSVNVKDYQKNAR